MTHEARIAKKNTVVISTNKKRAVIIIISGVKVNISFVNMINN